MMEMKTFLAPLAPLMIVGRDRELAQIKNSLLNFDQLPVLVLGYLPGIGKTALAAKVVHEEEVLDHYSGGVLWAALGRNPDPAALLGDWMVFLEFEPRQISNLSSAEERAAAIRERLSPEPMLIVLDDVWEAADVQPFLFGRQNDAYLITTCMRQVVQGLAGAKEFEIKELDEQGGLELLGWLAPEVTKAEPEISNKLVSTVDGLPLALMLIGKHLSRETEVGEPQIIRMALKKLQRAEQRLKLEMSRSPYFLPVRTLANAPLSLIASIQVSEEALDEDTRKALGNLSLMYGDSLRFTSDYGQEAGLTTEDEIQKLYEAGLIEEDWEYNRREWKKAGSSEVDLGSVILRDTSENTIAKREEFEMMSKETLYKIPRTVADYAKLQIGGNQEEFHRRAANYFIGWLRQFEETTADADPYLRQFRYTHPRWLRVMKSFLYHLSNTDPDYANLKLALLYFDAFWWWGCYLPFPFCDELLGKWRKQRNSPQDQQWTSLVSTFHQSYPTGYDKQGKGNWAEVERALLELRQLAGIDGEPTWLSNTNLQNLDKEEQSKRMEENHIRGITDMFLAESRRFRDIYDPQAEAYYLEAMAIFSHGRDRGNADDAWNVPWVLWHLGDLYMERRMGEAALIKVRESRSDALQGGEDICGRDNEIISNDYRVEADVYWQQEDFDRAFEKYTAAVFYSYLFLGCPLPPNFYTVEFYREMTSRVQERLKKLWIQGDIDLARRAVDYLRDFWTPYWETSGADPKHEAANLIKEGRFTELFGYLFPPFPTQAEMEEGEDSIYVQRVRGLADEMLKRIEEADK
jgi:AAA+ ATPase superfamily predicted ATPase